jgi:glutamate racemase
MRVDLLAGTVYDGAAAMAARLMISAPSSFPHHPTLLVFDSGLGGLTVFAEVARARPDARFVYAADDAGFPYGRLEEGVLVARVLAVMERLIHRFSPDLVVIACNTASTLVLPALRSRFSIPFVGTVPAIKPAVELSRTRHVAVLATPGTVRRDYTQELIRHFAGDCRVTLVGSTQLAGLAEAHLRGEPVDPGAVAAEIAPCFPADGPRTDAVVLGCTHYPLLADLMAQVAPWPVTWIDPAPAIARRVVQLAGSATDDAPGQDALAVFTSGERLTPALKAALGRRGLDRLEVEPVPMQA